MSFVRWQKNLDTICLFLGIIVTKLYFYLILIPKFRTFIMQVFSYILLSITILVLIIAGLAFVIGISIYNGLVMKKNQVAKSFSSVDVLLKKRWDLIPNLVAVVKNHMEFEQQTLAEITRLRSRAMSGDISPEQRIDVENQISRTMGNIMALIENYPDLKSNQHVTQLLESLNQ